MRRILTLLCVLALVPALSFAVTEDELRQQIQDLLNRVGSLQAQVTGGAQVTTNTTTGAPTYTPTMTTSSVLNGGLTISRELERGMRGNDVSQLQSFLSKDPSIYPEAEITGFFGPLTERAVERFQVACGIVTAGDYQSTGYGRVGPRTRAALSGGCGSTTATPSLVGAFLKVTPVTGNAPLSVSAEATVNTPRVCEAGTYTLNFGDNTQPVQIAVPATACGDIVKTVPHMYTAPGTYTVSLGIGSHKTTVQVSVGGVGTGTGMNNNPSTNTILPGSSTGSTMNFTTCINTIGSVIMESSPRQCRTSDGRTFVEGGGSTNTNTGSTGGTVNMDSLTASPSAGALPFNAQFTARINAGGSCSAGEYTLDFGDNVKVALPFAANSCSYQEYAVTHVYNTNGTYVAKLYSVPQASIGTASPVASANIVAGSGVTTAPSIPFTVVPAIGGDPKKVEVRFTLPNACLGYTLSWGDSTTNVVRSENQTGCSTTATEGQTLSHTYTSGGTYTITLTPTNGSSQNAVLSISS